MATPTRTRIDPRMLTALRTNPQLMASTVRMTSTFLPGFARSINRSNLPVFYENARPKASTKTIVADTKGKKWATLLYWLEKAEKKARPRFTHDGLTIDFEPPDRHPVIPFDVRPKAKITGIADDKIRPMQAWWRTEGGQARFTLNYDFESNNDRELIRGAIKTGQGLKVEVWWEHEARYQSQQSATVGSSGSGSGSGRNPTGTGTGRPIAMNINPAVIAAMRGRVGAPRAATIRHLERAAVPTRRVAAPMVELRPEIRAELLQPRPDRTRPPRPRPPRPQTPPPKDFEFKQTWSITLVATDPKDPIWQDGPSPWKAFTTPSGRKMYYRSTGRSAEYEFLPTEFRLGFDSHTGVPALTPYVYNDEDSEGNLVEDDRRIELRMMASPHVAVADREALRKGVQEAESVDLAVLVPPVVQGKLEIDLDLQGAESRNPEETVELAGVFWLEFDFALESWAPNLEQLSQPGGGVIGRVVLDILPETEGADVSVPVKLRLTDLHADVVEVRQQAPDSDGVPRRFVLRNQLQRPVQMGTPTIYLADQAGDASVPTNVRKGRPKGQFSTTLGPGEEREVVVQQTGGSAEWNALYIDLDDIHVAAPQEGWIEEINVNASDGQAAYPITVRAVNLREDAPSVQEYDSTHVSLQPLTGGTAEPPDGRLEKGAREWKTRMWLGLAQLWELEQNPATTKLYTIELQSDYTDMEGLEQRLTSSDANVSVRVLTTERSDTTYELLEVDDTVVETGLDRATAQARIAQRRDEGKTWKLRVPVSTVITPPDDDPVTDPVTTDPVTDPVTTDPVTDPVTTEPAGPPITVNPVALDWSVVSKVFVTLQIGEGDDVRTNTIVIEESTSGELTWSPERAPGTPVRYTIVYLLAAGGTKTVSGTDSSDMVMVLPPDP